ncbi:MAG: hypothetical protein R2695_11235 [Acidimicrobiales bacterium]
MVVQLGEVEIAGDEERVAGHAADRVDVRRFDRQAVVGEPPADAGQQPGAVRRGDAHERAVAGLAEKYGGERGSGTRWDVDSGDIRRSDRARSRPSRGRS